MVAELSTSQIPPFPSWTVYTSTASSYNTAAAPRSARAWPPLINGSARSAPAATRPPRLPLQSPTRRSFATRRGRLRGPSSSGRGRARGAAATGARATRTRRRGLSRPASDRSRRWRARGIGVGYRSYAIDATRECQTRRWPSSLGSNFEAFDLTESSSSFSARASSCALIGFDCSISCASRSS